MMVMLTDDDDNDDTVISGLQRNLNYSFSFSQAAFIFCLLRANKARR